MAASFKQMKICLSDIFLIYLVIYICTNKCGGTTDNSEKHSKELENAIKNRRAEVFSLETKSKPQQQPRKTTKKLDIYCHKGENRKDLKFLWSSVTVRLLITSDKFALYKGINESAVFEEYQAATQSWINSLIPWKPESVSLRPFNKTCIGVETEEDYSIQLKIKVVDPWLIGYLILGIILFFSAKRLSRNILFYYGSGISIGLVASLLILVFIISRFIPKKTGAYVVLAAGWSITVWFIQYLWENIQSVLEGYYLYVLIYFLTAAIISWAVCYYRGPPTNPRALNLIKWCIQAVALVLIYNSTQIPEVSVTVIVLIIIKHLIQIPVFMPQGLKSFWRKRFPPRVKLLTAEEYEKQGQEETRKALEELRSYCRSPDCDAWRTISRLHSPSRFAKWVEGDSHLSDEEVYLFDHDPLPRPAFDEDDEDEIDFRLGSH